MTAMLSSLKRVRGNMKFEDDLFGLPNLQIMDPLHGGIKFFEHERQIIDHPLFQRLRHISQNDILHLVFPGATHNRFQHSVGTMHIAGRLYRIIIKKYLAQREQAGVALLSHQQKKAIKFFYLCIRMAALMHDVGHAPFSHQFKKCPEIAKILSDPQTFIQLWGDDTWQDYHQQVPSIIEHEHYSVRLAHEILTSVELDYRGLYKADVICLLDTVDFTKTESFMTNAGHLCEVFLGKEQAIMSLAPTQIARKMQLLLHSIISGEVDVDKMDYILRDSYYTGCEYGVYNLDHLLNNILIGYSNEPWLGLAINLKGLGALEDFVFSRYQLYTIIYTHKTTIGFEWTLINAMSEQMKDADVAATVYTALTDITAFHNFTDTYFWEKFRQAAAGTYAYRLINRQKLKFLSAQKNLSPLEKIVVEKKLKTCHPQLDKLIIYDCKSHFSNISKDSYDKHLRILAKDPFSGKRQLLPIRQFSDFFEKFADRRVSNFFVFPRDIYLDKQ